MIFHIWEEEGKLCYETPEESTNTLNYAHDLLATNLLDYISWGFTVPYPGSDVYHICSRHNIIDSNTIYDVIHQIANISYRFLALPTPQSGQIPPHGSAH